MEVTEDVSQPFIGELNDTASLNIDHMEVTEDVFQSFIGKLNDVAPANIASMEVTEDVSQPFIGWLKLYLHAHPQHEECQSKAQNRYDISVICETSH